MADIVKVSPQPDGVTTYYQLWCPGCDRAHVINQTWGFNGDTARPTFTPSILVTMPPTEYRCHSFLTDGVWHFLGDCSHAMAGQSVPAVPWPYGESA